MGEYGGIQRKKISQEEKKIVEFLANENLNSRKLEKVIGKESSEFKIQL